MDIHLFWHVDYNIVINAKSKKKSMRDLNLGFLGISWGLQNEISQNVASAAKIIKYLFENSLL
jgi:hypothetical protein